jgi:hypothetical protein
VSELTILQYVGSVGGVAGILAVLIFFAYKYLVNQMREDRKFMEDRLTSLIMEYNKTCSNHEDAILKQTQVLTELITYLRLRDSIEDSKTR